MKSITVSRQKGNYAEHIVASWLSRVCLVRPVAEGTDIGVDLYCESVVKETPFLHFWVQVKAITKKNISEENGIDVAKFKFKTKDLRYWLQQPIPVYAFLVLVDKWPPSTPKRLYTIKISEQIIRKGIPDKKTLTLKTSEWADLDSIDEDLNFFVSKIVPWDTSILLLRHGIVTPIVQTEEIKGSVFTEGIAYLYLEKIIKGIMNTSAIGLKEALVFEHVDPTKKYIRKQFESVLRIFEDKFIEPDLHNFGLSMLVRAAHIDGDIEKAKKYVHNAVARVEKSENLDQKIKQARIDKFNELLKDFE